MLETSRQFRQTTCPFLKNCKKKQATTPIPTRRKVEGKKREEETGTKEKNMRKFYLLVLFITEEI